MSLTKKDPSLRVAATDPHLVSLGGGRLSTAVTIHYIHIGDTTIGSSTACSISLNGSGVRAVHCTIYRSEDNEVTIVPEQDARILIDGAKINEETNLTQGAMITIGNSNYLRFNNPDEAMMMRSAIGSNERISMPQIDFTQMPNGVQTTTNALNKGGVGGAVGNMVDTSHQSLELESYFESIINPNNIDHQQQQQIMSKSMIAMPTSASASAPCTLSKSSYKHISPAIDINGIQCPKVFTADLVTVNMPAKDVLGQKYASFAKNLAENHRNEKHMNNSLKCNSLAKSLAQQQNCSGGNSGSNSGSLTHIPSATNNYIHQTMMQPAASSTPMSLGKYKTNATCSNVIMSGTANATGHGGGGGGGGVGGGNTEQLLTKVQNSNAGRGSHSQANVYTYQSHQNHMNAYDRYPKPGTYGGLQIFPMNGVNTDINNGANAAAAAADAAEKNNLAYTEAERLEDMLKICTEYANQSNNTTNNMSNSNNSITSSPIVQNRIKTNGSLPREKKSPFHHDLTNAQWYSGSSGNLAAKPALNSSNVSTSSGYENVRLVGPNRVVEINGQVATSPSGASIKSGYENVSVMAGASGGKYVPQSPRTKIRTTCMSPKKDVSFGNSFGVLTSPPPPIAPKPVVIQPLPPAVKLATKQREYDQLIKSFERRLQLEMKAIEESSRYNPNTLVDSNATSATSTPSKRLNKNVNNLTLNLQQSHSLQNSPKLSKKPTPAPRLLNKSVGIIGSAQSLSGATEAAVAAAAAAASAEATNAVSSKELKRSRLELKTRIKQLTAEIADLQTQTADEQLAELNETSDARQSKLQTLQTKIHRLEAQRNATRVMEENQQAKLKQTIEMKQEQVKKLKAMLKQKPNNECLKEELEHVCESLESDRKTFEDLEFQYFEEESEFHACYEELKKVEKRLTLENELATCMERLSGIKALDDDEHNSDDDVTGDDTKAATKRTSAAKTTMQTSHSNLVGGVMSQSLFGSAELLCPKRASEDIMSKSVNENMFYNHKIELPRVETSTVISTSTPKRAQFQVYDIDVNRSEQANVSTAYRLSEMRVNMNNKDGGSCVNAGIDDDINDIDDDDETQSPFNLSLRGERFAVNPLERRVPSQDDIDRSCKVASDAPISATRGPSTKIFDSIREIERNRKLLLAQQGHHVIEHERQKMYDLKKKSHDEARTQYLLTMNAGKDRSSKNQAADPVELQKLKPAANQALKPQNDSAKNADQHNINNNNNNSNKQRHSQPELELQHSTSSAAAAATLPPPPLLPRSPRPLSEANSDRSYELLETNTNNALAITLAKRTNSAQSMEAATASAEEENKRASTNSNETGSAGSGGSSSGGERKRALAKHQRPLTRYLPIFSPDLNLRHHIESAGHQIDLCPHVFVDAHSCRGYLHKLGATFHAWSRRWFVLDRQRSALIYYSDKSERKPRGGAYFATIDEVYLDHLNASKSGRPHCTFIVKTKKRSYNLQAASDAAARIWIDAIITGAQGNLDY